MDLLFRTDEYALADTTGGRFASLASTLASMPDIRVQLDGFADERGAVAPTSQTKKAGPEGRPSGDSMKSRGEQGYSDARATDWESSMNTVTLTRRSSA